MTRLLLLTIFLLSANFSFAQTQAEMNHDAYVDYQKADKELNSVYQKILNEYKTDTVFIKNLKRSQKIWIQFRDAEMIARYPDRETGYYGSIQPVCWNMHLTELTEDRTKKLKLWLTGIKEGDPCSGSVKIIN